MYYNVDNKFIIKKKQQMSCFFITNMSRKYTTLHIQLKVAIVQLIMLQNNLVTLTINYKCLLLFMISSCVIYNISDHELVISTNQSIIQ